MWVHPEIDNPEYSSDASLGKYDEVCIAGFDLWQVKSGTIFDNVLITNDVAEAKKARWQFQLSLTNLTPT